MWHLPLLTSNTARKVPRTYWYLLSSTSSGYLIGETRRNRCIPPAAPDELAHRLDERYTDPRHVLALTLVVLLALQARTAIASISLYHRMVMSQHEVRQATRRGSV